MNHKIIGPLILAVLSSPVFAQMHIENAVIRTMPPGQSVTAAYMIISNHSDIPRKLVSARSIISSRVEIHHNSVEEGVMKMRQLEALEIPANGQAMLGANANHLMLFDLNQNLVEGESIQLTLGFDDGSSQDIMAVVTRLTGSSSNDLDDVMHKITPTIEPSQPE